MWIDIRTGSEEMNFFCGEGWDGDKFRCPCISLIRIFIRQSLKLFGSDNCLRAGMNHAERYSFVVRLYANRALCGW